jgi:hypothetical protein
MCSVFNSQNRSLLIGTFWGRANVAVPCKYRDAGSAQLEEKDFAFGDDDCLLPIYGRHPSFLQIALTIRAASATTEGSFLLTAAKPWRQALPLA